MSCTMEKSDGSGPAMSDSSTTLSRTRSQSHLDRTRSQNGYGVDDDDENDPTQGDDGEAQRETAPADGKDPYEVGWDEGESGDPLCPRSFPKARKWLITFIVSHVSLCLYVFV